MMKSTMKITMRVVAFFTPWAIVAVIAWAAYSVGHLKGYEEGQLHEDRMEEWREAVNAAFPAATPEPEHVQTVIKKIYATGYGEALGSLVPVGDHWDIHMTDNIPVSGYLGLYAQTLGIFPKMGCKPKPPVFR